MINSDQALAKFLDEERELSKSACTNFATSQIPNRYRQARLGDFSDLPAPIRIWIDRLTKVGIKAYTKPFLHLVGDVGRGKTHLAAAIIFDLIEKEWFFTHSSYWASKEGGGHSSCGRGNASEVMWWSYSQMIASFLEDSHNPNESCNWQRRTQQADFLVLDDVGAHKSTEWNISNLELIIDYRGNAGLPTIITTNFLIDNDALKESLGSRIISRLRGDSIYVLMEGPDRREMPQKHLEDVQPTQNSAFVVDGVIRRGIHRGTYVGDGEFELYPKPEESEEYQDDLGHRYVQVGDKKQYVTGVDYQDDFGTYTLNHIGQKKRPKT